MRQREGGVRTFVIGDCHGYPELIINVLRDARARYGGIRTRVDRLVFVGDLLDRGHIKGARQCLALIEALADEVLWGNHDLAVLVGYEIRDQDPGSYEFQDALRRRLREGSADGGPEWRLVTTAGDVLISHAGVSTDYADDLTACGGDLDELARRLDREFRLAAEHELATSEWKRARTRNKTSPTRYKLEKHGLEGLLGGVTQVIGHTPPEKLARGHDVAPSVALRREAVSGAALAHGGLYLVDPSVQWIVPDDGESPAKRWKGPPSPGLYRYAVIEDGSVKVHENGPNTGR